MEAIATRVEAIALRLEAIAIQGWRPSLFEAKRNSKKDACKMLKNVEEDKTRGS